MQKHKLFFKVFPVTQWLVHEMNKAELVQEPTPDLQVQQYWEMKTTKLEMEI